MISPSTAPQNPVAQRIDTDDNDDASEVSFCGAPVVAVLPTAAVVVAVVTRLLLLVSLAETKNVTVVGNVVVLIPVVSVVVVVALSPPIVVVVVPCSGEGAIEKAAWSWYVRPSGSQTVPAAQFLSFWVCT